MAFVTTTTPDLYATTSNLEEIPAGADPLQYMDDDKANQILVALTALHGWASGVPVGETANGHYLGLASGSSAAVSIAGGVRIRQSSGALDYSYNTGAYVRLLSKLTLASQATGDIMYASAADTWTRLAAGTDGYVLTLAGGVPTWAAGGGGGGVTDADDVVWTGEHSFEGASFNVNPLATFAAGISMATTNTLVVGANTLVSGDKLQGAQLAFSGQTAGDMLRFDGTNWVRIAAGASNTVIQGGTSPAFTNAPTVATLTTGNGSVSAQAVIIGDAGGLYRIADNQLGVSPDGTLRASFNTTQQTFYTDALIQETNAATTGIVDALTVRLRSTGTAAANLYTRALFQMHDDAGTDRDAGSLSWGWDDAGAATPDSSGYLHAMVAGTLTSVLAFNNNGIVTNAGAAATPAHRFNSDDNSGMYSAGADVLGFATNGTLRLSVSTIEVTSTLPYVAPAGSAGAPSLTFTGDTNTGFLSTAADAIGVTIGGTERVKFDANRISAKFGSGAYPASYDGAAIGSSNQCVFHAVSSSTTLYCGLVAENDSAVSLTATMWGSSAAGTRFGITLANSAEIRTSQPMLLGTSGSNTVNFGTNDIARIKLGTDAEAASTTAVYVSVNSAMQRVSVGANDSGGAGYRVLRIPN